MSRPDFEPRQGPRPDQFRVPERRADTAAVIAHAIATSPRFPFVTPEQTATLRAEPLPGNGGTWWFLDTIAAGNLFGNPDPKIIPEDQQRSLVSKIRADGSVLASGQFGRAGLTTVPRDDEQQLAAMYRVQLIGNGSGPRDITGFFALDRLTGVQVRSQKTGQMTPVTVIVAATVTRNSDLDKTVRYLGRMGYKQRENEKRIKTKTNRRR